MNNTSIELLNRLPQGLQEIYKTVDLVAKEMGCAYLVVGAIARDLVMVHGYGATIERGTLDVDFGINVESWDAFTRLKERLTELGFRPDRRALQKLHYRSSDDLPWEIDIVPFGAIENENSIISWPPGYDINMSVLGFKEALQHQITAMISKAPEVAIPVASPVGIGLLKLVAWLDRPAEKRRKDATDIKYLIESFHKIPLVRDALYDEGWMDAQEYDLIKASAMKLGNDIGQIASQGARDYLETNLFSQAERIEVLAREMSGRRQHEQGENFQLIQILIAAARQASVQDTSMPS